MTKIDKKTDDGLEREMREGRCIDIAGNFKIVRIEKGSSIGYSIMVPDSEFGEDWIRMVLPYEKNPRSGFDFDLVWREAGKDPRIVTRFKFGPELFRSFSESLSRFFARLSFTQKNKETGTVEGFFHQELGLQLRFSEWQTFIGDLGNKGAIPSLGPITSIFQSREDERQFKIDPPTVYGRLELLAKDQKTLLRIAREVRVKERAAERMEQTRFKIERDLREEE